MVRVGKTGLMSLLVASLAASVAVAQPPARGPGGFGGMGRGGGGVIALLSQEAVQKELGLSKESVEKLTKLAQDAMQETRDESAKVVGEGGFQALQGLGEKERQATMDKMNEVRKGIQAKYQPKLKEALTAEQLQRAQQIAWQAAGSAALADEELTKQLAVTKEQQDKIAAINKEFGDKQRELFAAGAGGAGGDVRAKMTELNKERDAKTNEVLSKEQQEKFTTLKGKPFDLAQLQQGGPGGGGPGGRPGAGGRPQRGQPKDGDKK